MQASIFARYFAVFAIVGALSACGGGTTTEAGTAGGGNNPPPNPDSSAPQISNVTASGAAMNSVTLTWTTNEAATSQVEYGTTNAYGESTDESSAHVTSHSVQLTGLAAGTTYHFRVHSRDAAGNAGESRVDTFDTATTPPPPDTTAPTISNVAVTAISANSATINWATNEPAKSQVQYGTTAALGSTTTETSVHTTNHSVRLSSLSGNTIYHYRARSRDAAGNAGQNIIATFTTSNTSTPDTTPPSISNIRATAITATGATITWTTNESAKSQVEYGTTTSYGSTTTETSTLVTNHSVALTGRTANTLYHYRLRSRDAAGNVATSTDQTFTTTGNLSVTLRWDRPTTNVDDLAGYRVYKAKVSKGYAGTTPQEVTAPTQQLIITGLSPGIYFFVVNAFDSSGNESIHSNELSVTVP